MYENLKSSIEDRKTYSFSERKEKQMATKEKQVTTKDVDAGTIPAASTLPVLVSPPSVLAVVSEQDEVAKAFGGSVQTARAEVQSIPLALIDHKLECVTVNGEPVKHFGGYPIHWFQTRSFWPKPFRPGSEEPPECWSLDMVTPSDSSTAKQAKTCATCPRAKFGSSPNGEGQACRTRTTVFLLDPKLGNPPVAALAMPPSSIRALLGTKFAPGYFARAKQVKTRTGRAIGYHELVWMEANVLRAGELHCILDPKPGGICPSMEEAQAIAAVREQLMPAMESLRQETIASQVPEESPT